MKNKNPLGLPRQEDITETNFGSHQLKVTRITDENRDALVEITISMYVGEKCKYCLHEFTSVEDLRARKVVCAGYHEHGRLACKKCWDANNEPDGNS